MGKANLDWSNIDFSYRQTPQRYVANYKDGHWEKGGLTEDATIVLNECAGILQYCQEVFEGLKAYRTKDGRIVTFRPDLNAKRMMDSAKRLVMPPVPEEMFMEAVDQVVAANKDWIPPYESGGALYLRPY
ncbi:MAG: aminotransferase class IV, partial [Selenomonadaceae bacterium]|nr:aminotransferase class IV [Selenomonadaceae bacterium]